MTKRRRVTLEEIRKFAVESGLYNAEEVKTIGICALVDVENMGFCKDRKTRWYHFDLDGRDDPCVYYKY